MPERLSVKQYFTLLLFIVVWTVAATVAFAQGTAFTDQGRLTDAANPADGLFDMQFKLFNTMDVGTGKPVGKLHAIGSGGSIGVWGEGGSGGSQGVYGKGFFGLFGKSTDANGYGVYGEPPDNCVGNCWAGFFNGHVRIGAGADLFVDSDGDFSRVFAIEFIETSDRNAKANFASVDTRSILERLASVPIQSWNFKGQPETERHIGPMAQDFRAAFNLGTDDKHISTVDADGVALAAIQGLYRLVQEKEKQIERLQTRVARLERRAKKRRQGRIARIKPGPA